jgi:hypothetical protein
MKKLTLITAAILSAFAISSCSSSKHMSDVDQSVDFASYTTYTLVSHLEEDAPKSLTTRRIEKAIHSELEGRNYTSSNEASDLKVLYTTDMQSSTSYYGSSYGGGYRRRWGGGHSYTTINEVETKYGVININVVDAKTNHIVWSTSIKRSLPNKNKEEKLNKEIAKAFKDFPVQIAENSEEIIAD